MAEFGALPSQMLRQLVNGGFIKGVDSSYIRSASIDLALTSEMYRLPGLFLPMRGEKIKDFVTSDGCDEHDMLRPLERDVVYIARLAGDISLPTEVYGYANPKSTTGRTDTHVRLVADNVLQYDQLQPPGWRGEHWLLVTPKSFPIRLEPGLALSQLRLFNRDTRLKQLPLEIAVDEYKLIWSREGVPMRYADQAVKSSEGSLLLTLDLDSKPVGWECLSPNKIFDFSTLKGSYEAVDFFRPIYINNGSLTIRRGRFYILSTHESVRVPPHLACEMRPIDERFGDFRAHYAGFVDPGWGWGVDGEGQGRPLTLEVRPFEDLTFRRGQVIARVKFEEMIEPPPKAECYDADAPSYGVQHGPRLAKQFRVD